MISFYLSKTTGSKFTFGGYLENMIKANQAVVWENMVSVDSGRYYWWQLKIRDLIFQGDSVFSNTYQLAIADSGTSFMLVPLKEMMSIANALNNKFYYEYFACTSGSNVLCAFVNTKCSSIIPKLDPIKV